MSKGSKSSLFYAYRYFIVHTGQQSFLSYKSENRKMIHEMTEACIENKKIAVKIHERRHLLIYIRSYNNNIHLFKFCKDITITKYELNEQASDIVETKESNLPFIYLIIDLSKQRVLLEKKTTVFHDMVKTKNTFRQFVETYFHDINYTFSIDEISDTRTFWQNVSSADEIYELSLYLRSPNFFGGIFETNEFLKEVNKALNNEETDVKFKNTNGNLNISHESMDDPLKYASAGGGSWSLKIKRKNNKHKTTITSRQSVKTIEFENLEEEISIFSEDYIIEKINSIDEI